MTREEQLACLKDRPCSVCKMRTDKGCISWECVFEQTPDEEKEPCDCISREEVCDYIAEFVNHEYATDRERELVKHIIGGIQHLPSIQPTTKENLVVEDCISRKAVLDALNKWDWQELYLPVHFKDIIDDLPSIQPKTELETWEGIHAQVTAPKGTFDKIWNEAEDNDEI